MIQETTIQVLHFTTTNAAQCSVTEVIVFNNSSLEIFSFVWLGPRRLKEGVAERDPLLYNQNS